jgi:hypothetical protein
MPRAFSFLVVTVAMLLTSAFLFWEQHKKGKKIWKSDHTGKPLC